MTHPEPPWIPYRPGDPVPMGRVRLRVKTGEQSDFYTQWKDWNGLAVTAYQRHPDQQLIADMRDELYREYAEQNNRTLILRAEAIVGRAPGLPNWLVEYLDGGKE